MDIRHDFLFCLAELALEVYYKLLQLFVLELCFLELSLCTFGANAAALIASAGK